MHRKAATTGGDPPVASDRFPGGLSFRSGAGCSSITGNSAIGYYAASGETGHEQFRVTATGGPTTPRATDHATLPGGTTIQGDSTARSPWIPVKRAPSEVGGRREWSVSTGDGNRYDIASFTIETTYFAPAP